MNGEKRSRIPRRRFEHYEVLEPLASDSLVATYRGCDLRDRSSVLIRHIASGLLGEKDARRMVDRLRPMIGCGGAALSALKDVGRHESIVFSVEDWPRGTSLAQLFRTRSFQGRAGLEPSEALFVLTQLAAALAAIPEGSWHGDVRAERVWIDADRVLLTGGFLLAALPGDAVAAALTSAPSALSGSFAPEVREGLGGRASDRWGVASILREALLSKADAPRGGIVAKELSRLFDTDPSNRPSTLESLAIALANSANLPAPELPQPSATSSNVNSDDQTQIMGTSLASDTLQIPFRFDDETAPQSIPMLIEASPHEVNSAEFELLDSELDAQVARSKDLDPALVRAALGISSSEPSPRKNHSPRKNPSSVPVMPPLPATPASTRAPPKPKASRHRRSPEPVPLPTDIKPIPRPQLADGEVMSGPVLFDASKPVVNSEALAKKAKKARVAAEPTMIVQRPAPPASNSPRARPRRRSAWILVVLALLIGSLIVSAGLWYRSAKNRDAERYQRIEQRLRELRGE